MCSTAERIRYLLIVHFELCNTYFGVSKEVHVFWFSIRLLQVSFFQVMVLITVQDCISFESLQKKLGCKKPDSILSLRFDDVQRLAMVSFWNGRISNSVEFEKLYGDSYVVND